MIRNIFISVHDAHKSGVAKLARDYSQLGFTLFATEGTAKALQSAGVPVTQLYKLSEGRPHVVDMIKNGEIALIINTPSGKKSQSDMRAIRAAAILHNIPCITTLQGAWAAVNGIEAILKEELN